MKDRVLLVDDEPGVLRSASRVLAPQYEVRTALTPGQALELLDEFEPDLAIIDIRMPEMDGFQLMARLREGSPRIDIIFMTGIVHEVDTQLIRAIRERAFYFITKPFDRDVLLALVDRCLELRRLGRENALHVERLEGQLAEARQFQLGLLPGTNARIGGTSLSAYFGPCDAVGGDIYDFVDAGQGRAAFLVADTSGHGVSAAMFTGIVKSAFHDAHAEHFAPSAVLDRIARALRPFDDHRFVTAFCGRVSAGTLEYANAGAPPALLGGPLSTPRKLGLTGPLISPAFEDLTWEMERAELGDGERLLVYTDGVTEMRSEDELFGEERLVQLFEQSQERGAALLDAIVGELRTFAGGRPEDDDVTLLTVGG